MSVVASCVPSHVAQLNKEHRARRDHEEHERSRGRHGAPAAHSLEADRGRGQQHALGGHIEVGGRNAVEHSRSVHLQVQRRRQLRGKGQPTLSTRAKRQNARQASRAAAALLHRAALRAQPHRKRVGDVAQGQHDEKPSGRRLRACSGKRSGSREPGRGGCITGPRSPSPHTPPDARTTLRDALQNAVGGRRAGGQVLQRNTGIGLDQQQAQAVVGCGRQGHGEQPRKRLLLSRRSVAPPRQAPARVLPGRRRSAPQSAMALERATKARASSAGSGSAAVGPAMALWTVCSSSGVSWPAEAVALCSSSFRSAASTLPLAKDTYAVCRENGARETGRVTC